MPSKSKRRLVWLAPIVAVVLLGAFHPLWLRMLGRFLVKAEEPARADAAVVLAGDPSGDRIRKALSLARANYVPRIIVSGPCCVYGHNEGELAVAMIVQQGAPRELFVIVPNNSHSTVEEARYIVDHLRRTHVASFLLVTSDYHTRRAGAVYRSAARDLKFRVIAAPDRDFQPDWWWKSRQGQKVFLGEWQRTVAHWLGI